MDVQLVTVPQSRVHTRKVEPWRPIMLVNSDDWSYIRIFKPEHRYSADLTPNDDVF